MTEDAPESQPAVDQGPMIVAACAYCQQTGVESSRGLGRLYIGIWDDFCEAWRTSDIDQWDRCEEGLAPLEGVIHAAFDGVLLRFPAASKDWIRLGDLPPRLPGSYVPILSHLIVDPARDGRYALSHGICPGHYEELMGHPSGDKNGRVIGP